MNDRNEVYICPEESPSKIGFVSNCSSPVNFLSEGCRGQDSKLTLLQDSPASFSSTRHSDENLKSIEIQGEINTYIQQLHDFKGKITTVSKDLIQELEFATKTKIQMIDDLIEQSSLKLGMINRYPTEMSKPEQQLMLAYETKGIKGLIDGHIESLALEHHDVKRAIGQMISLVPSTTRGNEVISTAPAMEFEDFKSLRSTRDEEILRGFQETYQQGVYEEGEYSIIINTPPSEGNQPTSTPRLDIDTSKLPIFQPSRYIFSVKNSTKELVSYDADLDIIKTYDLSKYLKYNFIYSASCLLPDGQVMISGGYSPYQEDTYLIDTSQASPICTKLGSLNTLRSRGKLVYHQGSVYMLGGTIFFGDSSNKAERIGLDETKWVELPDMRESRYDFGVYAELERIYLIGGRENTTIEYYDISLESFYILPDILVPLGGIICAVIDDLIYAVGHKRWTVYSKEFKELKSENANIKHPSSFSDVIVKNSKIFYISSSHAIVFSFDATTHTVAQVKQA
jgi:hypothetical protein